MPNRFAAAALALAVALATPALSGPLVDAATKAEAAIAAGDFDAWFAANETLRDTAWTSGGLHLANVFATTGDAPGFGAYDLRPDTTYAAGEPIYLYVEPRGYGYGDLGNGMLEIAFDIDLKVLDSGGTVLLDQKSFTNFSVQTRVKARELMINLTANLTGAPPGDYTLEFTLNDKYGGQSASFTNDITIQ